MVIYGVTFYREKSFKESEGFSMKKGLTIGIAAVLAAGSVTPAVVAATPILPNDNIIVAKKDNKKDEEEERFVEKVHIEELTLEEAIRYGLNSSYSLMELEYTIENLRLQERIYEDQLDVAESSYESAQREIAEINKYLEETSQDTATINIIDEVAKLKESLASLDIDPSQFNPVPDGGEEGESNIPDANARLNDQIRYLTGFLENALKYVEENEKIQEREAKKQRLAALNSSISSLYFQVKQLENTIDNLDIQRTQMFNNRVQAREQMKLPIMSNFISIVLTEEQLDFMKQTLETQQSQLNAMKTRYELGLVSRKDFEKNEREIADLETEIAELEKQLKHDKTVFATTIGITYGEDFKLVRPDLGEVTLIQQKTSTEELIKKSFDMVNARTELRIKQDALDDYDDEENRTRDGERIRENEVEVAKLKMEALEVELKNAIDNTFHQVQKQYQALKDAEKDLQQARADNADLQLYYDLGLLSKLEFDAANTSVKQAELNYISAKYQYYLLTKQAELMENGVIVKN